MSEKEKRFTYHENAVTDVKTLYERFSEDNAAAGAPALVSTIVGIIGLSRSKLPKGQPGQLVMAWEHIPPELRASSDFGEFGRDFTPAALQIDECLEDLRKRAKAEEEDEKPGSGDRADT